MIKIIVVASELAIITGHNKYEKIQKAIDSVLNRSGIIKIYIPKSKVEETLLNLKDKDFIKIRKELKLSGDTLKFSAINIAFSISFIQSSILL